MIRESTAWAPGSFPLAVERSQERQLVEMTEAARAATEGATERRELAEGKCQGTWRNYPHENLRNDPTIYRQHRCGRELLHRGTCRCRYCGRDRANA